MPNTALAKRNCYLVIPRYDGEGVGADVRTTRHFLLVNAQAAWRILNTSPWHRAEAHAKARPTTASDMA